MYEIDLKFMYGFLCDDVISYIFKFLNFKDKMFLNKEFYTNTREKYYNYSKFFKTILHRNTNFKNQYQSLYKYYNFIIDHKATFILEINLIKNHLPIWGFPRHKSWHLPDHLVAKQTDMIDHETFIKKYSCVSNLNNIDAKIAYFRDFIHNEMMEFKILFDRKLWPEMKNKFGSLVSNRYNNEYLRESYVFHNRFGGNKKDYILNGSWLK